MADGDPQGERWTAARRAAERAAETAAEFAAAGAAADRAALLEAVVRGTAARAAAGDCDETATNTVRAAVLAATALWSDAEAAEAAWEQAADVVFGGASDWRRSAVTAAFCDWVQHDAAAAATWRADAQRRRKALLADLSGTRPEAPPPPDDWFVAACAKYADQFPSGTTPRTWLELAEALSQLGARQDPPSRDIDEAFAVSIRNATVAEPDPAIRRTLAKRLAPLSARHDPPSREIDHAFAAALRNATVGESNSATVRALAEQIEVLSVRYDPPAREIDQALAGALVMATIVEPDPAVRRTLAERIAPLSARHEPPLREIDERFAMVLGIATVGEPDPAVVRALAERIAPLSARHDPPSRGIDEAFAAALYNATIGVPERAVVRALAERIAPLSARHDPPSREIDHAFARTLANATDGEPDPAVVRALAERIASLSARHDPPSREIDHAFARTLANATDGEPDPAVVRALAERIAPLSARHDPPSREIDHAFARALQYATVDEPDPSVRRTLGMRIAPLSARHDPPSQEIDEFFAGALHNATVGAPDPAVVRALAERIAPLSARHDPPSREIDRSFANAIANAMDGEPDPAVVQALAERIEPLSARHDPPSREIDMAFAKALYYATIGAPDPVVVRALAERIAPLSARHDPPSRKIDQAFTMALANATVSEPDPELILVVAARMDGVATRHSPPLLAEQALGRCIHGQALRQLGRRLEAYSSFCAASSMDGAGGYLGNLFLLDFLLGTAFAPAPLCVSEKQRRILVRSPAEAAERLWTCASPEQLSDARIGAAAKLTRRIFEIDQSESCTAAISWSTWLKDVAENMSATRLTAALAASASTIGLNAAQSASRLEDEAGAELRCATESFLTAALAATERCPDGPARLAAGWALTDARLRLQMRDEAAFRAALAAAETERRERLSDPDARGLYLPNVSRSLRLAAAASADETRSLEERAAARRLAEAYAAVLPAHRLDAAVAAWGGAGAAEARAATTGLSRGPDPAVHRTRAAPDEFRVQLCLDRDDPLLGAGITALRDDGGKAESECATFGAAYTDDLCRQADAAFAVFDLLQRTGWAAAGPAERRRRAAKALGCEDAELAPLSESEMRERLSLHAADLLAPLADAFFGCHAVERLRGRRVLLTPPPEWTGLPLWSLQVADARGVRTPLAELAREVLLCPLPGGVAAPAAGLTSGTAWLCTAEFDPREAPPANAAYNRDVWLRSLGGEYRVCRVGGAKAASAGWAGRRTVHVTGHFDPAAPSGGSRTNLADLIGDAVRGAPPAEWVLEMCGAGRAEQGAGVRRWAAAVVLLATGARRVVAPTLQVAPGSSFCREWFAAYYAARATGADAPDAARRAYDAVGDLGTVLERPDRWMPFVVFAVA